VVSEGCEVRIAGRGRSCKGLAALLDVFLHRALKACPPAEGRGIDSAQSPYCRE
jgi:hypothetical protein